MGVARRDRHLLLRYTTITTSASLLSLIPFLPRFFSSSCSLSPPCLRFPFFGTDVTCEYHSGAHVARETVTKGTVSPLQLLLLHLFGGQCCIGDCREPFKGLTSVMQINHRDTSKVAHYARDNSLFFNCSSSDGYDREKSRCVPTLNVLASRLTLQETGKDEALKCLCIGFITYIYHLKESFSKSIDHFSLFHFFIYDFDIDFTHDTLHSSDFHVLGP